MVRVSVVDETGMELTYRNAINEKEIDFIKHEYSVFYPKMEVTIREYLAHNKENAEKALAARMQKGN